jgi:ankyrin repeat protein
MNLTPPPPLQDNDPIITQFRPEGDQWELTDDNIKRIDPKTGETILHNYYAHINTTPLEVYRYLIETKGCDINVEDNRGDTPLHRAFDGFQTAENGDEIGCDITILIYLFTQKGVDVSIKNQYGCTLLHAVCERINYLPLDVFKVLIETHGFDVNVRDNDNDTPLHVALAWFNPYNGGDINVLTYLLSQEGIDGDTKGQCGYTFLHMACDMINYCPLDAFKFLIETMGCDVNAQDDSKNTPVQKAFRYFDPNEGGDITVLTYLFTQNNVNLNVKGKQGFNLLHYACTNNLPSYKRSVELNAEFDTVFCQIVELIAERCVQQVLDETTLE